MLWGMPKGVVGVEGRLDLVSAAATPARAGQWTPAPLCCILAAESRRFAAWCSPVIDADTRSARRTAPRELRGFRYSARALCPRGNDRAIAATPEHPREEPW
jgi:hypothetical protein